MTEQLMDTLSNKKHKRLLLMSEHGIAPPLSPAAQTISDAYQNNLSSYMETGLIAALRAAADQLDHADSAHTLYAIATELEGSND